METEDNMGYNDKLKKYIPLVSFISAACGRDYEVILHDTTNPASSVIAIENGHLSGRKIGDPMTDFALSTMNDKVHENKNFIANYEGRLKDGKTFVSSTYFIKEGGKLIGMLCINYDASQMIDLSRNISYILESFHILPDSDKEPYTENLDSSISNIAESIIKNTVACFPVASNRMTASEKIEIIKKLQAQDIFSTKGTVPQVAEALSISEPTVYRYLKMIKGEK